MYACRHSSNRPNTDQQIREMTHYDYEREYKDNISIINKTNSLFTMKSHYPSSIYVLSARVPLPTLLPVSQTSRKYNYTASLLLSTLFSTNRLVPEGLCNR